MELEGYDATSVLVEDGRVTGLLTDRGVLRTSIVVNCAGGWISVRDAIKKPLPKDAPMPGKFRVHAEASAEAPAAEPKGE